MNVSNHNLINLDVCGAMEESIILHSYVNPRTVAISLYLQVASFICTCKIIERFMYEFALTCKILKCILLFA